MQVRRNGQPVDGFGLGGMSRLAWVEARNKLQDMDRLIASGRGSILVEGGGCTEPGGGIIPAQHTAIEMAALLRQQMGAGLGDRDREKSDEAPSPPAPRAPWKDAVIMSLVGVATGWILEEVARRTFRKRRR